MFLSGSMTVFCIRIPLLIEITNERFVLDMFPRFPRIHTRTESFPMNEVFGFTSRIESHVDNFLDSECTHCLPFLPTTPSFALISHPGVVGYLSFGHFISF